MGSKYIAISGDIAPIRVGVVKNISTLLGFTAIDDPPSFTPLSKDIMNIIKERGREITPSCIEMFFMIVRDSFVANELVRKLNSNISFVSDRCFLDDMVNSYLYSKWPFKKWLDTFINTATISCVPELIVILKSAKLFDKTTNTFYDNVYDIEAKKKEDVYVKAVEYLKLMGNKSEIVTLTVDTKKSIEEISKDVLEIVNKYVGKENEPSIK